ncbi:hypothetical protein PAXRUDRAFT_150070 [Paxillus rubicundulus Ve08.2h10]|uniref:Uncharacterized protein n=1 Tax=Paxillus rubicundulus Ve08.2h10 TaxID=930991 RepID=A0A0D0DXN5_9AGAM|nr:hypothetical protein PAXRUDRAFT_150070 [Paxillus rubicundulus Ve08.2h10]
MFAAHLQGGRVTLLLHCTLQVSHWLNKPLPILKRGLAGHVGQFSNIYEPFSHFWIPDARPAVPHLQGNVHIHTPCFAMDSD